MFYVVAQDIYKVKSGLDPFLKAEMMQRIEGFGVEPLLEISEERLHLIHRLSEALQLAKSQCTDEELVKVLEEIAVCSQKAVLR
jgi:hypothetical protein